MSNQLHDSDVNRFLQQIGSFNDDVSKKELDNQKMSPLVASFMPSQASNPFFRLSESEIPASPCSESAGSESSQSKDHHVARRVSFSPGDAAAFQKTSAAPCEAVAGAHTATILKSAAASNLHVQPDADGKRIEKSRSAIVHDQSLKCIMQTPPQMIGKSLSDSVVMRNQSANSFQPNTGVPTNLSPGLAVIKPQASTSTASFAAATYCSPHLHSPTPRPRFSTLDGMA